MKLKDNPSFDDLVKTGYSSNKAKVWHLEDSDAEAFVVRQILENDCEIINFKTIKEFEIALGMISPRAELGPDLILADNHLEDGDFIDWLDTEASKPLVGKRFIIISSSDEADHIAKGFRRGSLDFLSKPFGKSELKIKVQRFLGRYPAASLTIDKVSGPYWTLDAKSHQLKASDGRIADFTWKEFKLLELLCEQKDLGANRELMVTKIWGATLMSAKVLDVHLSHLRKKLVEVGLTIERHSDGCYRLSSDRIQATYGG